MLYPFFLVITAIIISLILTLRINTKFECIKKQDSSDVIILFHSFSGIVKIKYEIPITNLLSILEKAYRLLLGEKGILTSTDKQYSKLDDMEDKYTYIEKIIKYIKLYLKVMQKCLVGKNQSIIKLSINIAYGTDDAFWTGIMGGYIYSIAGSIDSLLSTKFKLTEKNISIQPDFTRNVFELEVLCILSIRLVHIIRAGLFYLLKLIKEKFKNRIRWWFKWQNIL